jgi:hypothetical protein
MYLLYASTMVPAAAASLLARIMADLAHALKIRGRVAHSSCPSVHFLFCDQGIRKVKSRSGVLFLKFL